MASSERGNQGQAVALILESGPEELAFEPCSGACREAIELYFSTPPERWRAPLTDERFKKCPRRDF
jgi:hypothetical protein